eukprot:1020905-Pleurochrysis_carterae.AAC.1
MREEGGLCADRMRLSQNSFLSADNNARHTFCWRRTTQNSSHRTAGAMVVPRRAGERWTGRHDRPMDASCATSPLRMMSPMLVYVAC